MVAHDETMLQSLFKSNNAPITHESEAVGPSAANGTQEVVIHNGKNRIPWHLQSYSHLEPEAMTIHHESMPSNDWTHIAGSTPRATKS